MTTVPSKLYANYTSRRYRYPLRSDTPMQMRKPHLLSATHFERVTVSNGMNFNSEKLPPMPIPPPNFPAQTPDDIVVLSKPPILPRLAQYNRTSANPCE